MLIIYQSDSAERQLFQQYKQYLKEKRIEHKFISRITELETYLKQQRNQKSQSQILFDFHYFIKPNQQYDTRLNDQLQSFQFNLIIFLQQNSKHQGEDSFQYFQNYRNFPYNTQIEVYNLVQYLDLFDNQQQILIQFQGQIDLSQKKVALFISLSEIQKNKIFKIISLNQQIISENSYIQNEWVLINAPVFDFHSQSNEQTINDYQKIFQQYQKQISVFFLVINLERTDISQNAFQSIYFYFQKFKQKIVVLLVDDQNEGYQIDTKLNNYLENIANVNHYQYINKRHLSQEKNQKYNTIQQNTLQCLIKQILADFSDPKEIGIDIKGTIFEELDQSEIEKSNQDTKKIQNHFLEIQYKQEIEKIDKVLQANKQKKEELQKLIDNSLKELKILNDSDNLQQQNKEEFLYKLISIYKENNGLTQLMPQDNQRSASSNLSQSQIHPKKKHCQNIK